MLCYLMRGPFIFMTENFISKFFRRVFYFDKYAIYTHGNLINCVM